FWRYERGIAVAKRCVASWRSRAHTRRPVIPPFLLGRRAEGQHSDDKEQHDSEHDTAAPHGKPDDSEIGARFIRDPRLPDTAGWAHVSIEPDGSVTQAACDDRRSRSTADHFTKTHSGLRSGNATSPMIAAAATSSGLLTFQRNKTTRLPTATSAVSQSPMAIF